MDEAERLFEQGIKAIEEGDTARARKIGRRLIRMRYSGGYELEARAWREDERLDKAVEVLQEGVKVAPQAWLLWHWLGSCLSDSGYFAEAREAFGRGLTVRGAPRGSMRYNIASTLHREQRFEVALNVLEECAADCLGDARLWAHHQALKLLLLTTLERYEEALSLSERLTQSGEADPLADVQGEVLGCRAIALLKGRRLREEAMVSAWRALHHDTRNTRALRVIRELAGQISEAGQYFKMMIEGRWHQEVDQPGEVPSFYCVYFVVADSSEEALALLARHEPEAVRASLRIDRAEVVERRPGALKGVYDRTGRIFHID